MLGLRLYLCSRRAVVSVRGSIPGYATIDGGTALPEGHRTAKPSRGELGRIWRDGQHNASGQAAALRRELSAAYETLKSITEDQEVANEELLSCKEELQSTNEEVETAKEELQSANEITILNGDLRNRNAELSVLADDLSNLLTGVNIPVLILDNSRKIRRYFMMSSARNWLLWSTQTILLRKELPLQARTAGKKLEAVAERIGGLATNIHQMS